MEPRIRDNDSDEIRHFLLGNYFSTLQSLLNIQLSDGNAFRWRKDQLMNQDVRKSQISSRVTIIITKYQKIPTNSISDPNKKNQIGKQHHARDMMIRKGV